MWKANERERFDRLYADYSRLVRAVLFNMAGESALDDLTQETFLRVWRGLPSFAVRSTVKTWIYRIAVNTAIDHLRTARWVIVDPAQLEAVASEPQAGLEERETQMVRLALEGLDVEHRSVVVLFYFEELKVEEVAKILELPAGTVKSRLFHARQTLKELLKDKKVAI